MKSPESPLQIHFEIGPGIVWFRPNPRARHYRITLQRDGTFRCTIPRRGTRTEAEAFVQRHHAWMESRLRIRASHPHPPTEWRPGTPVWLDGIPIPITCHADGSQIAIGSWVFPRLRSIGQDLRPLLERELRRRAVRDLPQRALELAALHGITVTRVQVRNQRARWGSCSARGVLSLNWRLIQVPPGVRDYVILHELAHVRHLNHSPRFWNEVARLCPDYPQSERWLKEHGNHLL
jgi:predicted metal-dependent hydrolase